MRFEKALLSPGTIVPMRSSLSIETACFAIFIILQKIVVFIPSTEFERNEEWQQN